MYMYNETDLDIVLKVQSWYIISSGIILLNLTNLDAHGQGWKGSIYSDKTPLFQKH